MKSLEFQDKIWKGWSMSKLEHGMPNPMQEFKLKSIFCFGLKAACFSCTYTQLTVSPFISESSQLCKMSHGEIRKGGSVGIYKGGLFLRESPALNCFQKIINRAIFVKDTLSLSGLYIQLSFQSAFNIVLQQLAGCNTHLGKHSL